MNIKISAVAVAALLSAVGPVSAGTVDFEDTGVFAYQSVVNFSSGGFNFAVDSAYGAGELTNSYQRCTPACPVNGTVSFLSAFPSTLTMTQAGGGAFSLLGFQGAGSFNHHLVGYTWDISDLFPTHIDVTATLSGGGTITQSFALDNSAMDRPLDFSAYTFSAAFGSITSATFSSRGSSVDVNNGYSLDNIVAGSAIPTAAVPEPGPAALVLAGLGLLVARTRRRAAAHA